MLLGACEMGGRVQGVDVCGPWRPILVGPEDQFSDPTARAILTHNETGRELCGWGN